MTEYWSSEAVSCGHPDKVADQVADSVLDIFLAHDPQARVACEVTLTSHLALVTGEIGTVVPRGSIDVESVVRNAICAAGYNNDEVCYNGDTIDILNSLKRQSTEISNAVLREDGEIGAGDQGMMFGFATNEYLPTLMPLAHQLAFALIYKQQEFAKLGVLRPDAKSQITLRYDQDRPIAVDTVVLSTQHSPLVKLPELRDRLNVTILNILQECCNKHTALGGKPFEFETAKMLINPAGEWNIGGPVADTGLSGRKIVVDNFGADCQIGGGSFSGKDPTKVDRSGAYAARYIAKNIVAAGFADKCQVQICYAIGVVEPVSVRIQTFGTAQNHTDASLKALVLSHMSLTPKAIIERFGLRRPIFYPTSTGGHFGHASYPWEQLDLVPLLHGG